MYKILITSCTVGRSGVHTNVVDFDNKAAAVDAVNIINNEINANTLYVKTDVKQFATPLFYIE